MNSLRCSDCRFCVVSKHCAGNAVSAGGLFDCARDGHVILCPDDERCTEHMHRDKEAQHGRTGETEK